MESACAAPSLLMGDKIEVSRDMDTETRRVPLGVCARCACGSCRIRALPFSDCATHTASLPSTSLR